MVLRKAQADRLKFCTYADADFGNDIEIRRSVTGYVVQVGGLTMAYKRKMHSIVNEDTCSAEFVAASMCSNKIVWMHNLCAELKLKYDATQFYQDNQSTFTQFVDRTKNYKGKSVGIKYHCAQQLAEDQVVDVHY